MKNITLYLAGDSTAAKKRLDEQPMTGWGEDLQQHFCDQLIVANHAMNGRSTRSFITDGRLADIEKLLQPGDYLFIQFGHNDGKKEDSSRYTDSHDFQANLENFIQIALEKQAVPVLLTSISRRKFINNTQIDPLAVDIYPEITRHVAEQHKIALLDLFSKSKELYELLGPTFSRNLFMQADAGIELNYPSGIEDNTHLSRFGASVIAKMVIKEIQTQLPELARYLLE